MKEYSEMAAHEIENRLAARWSDTPRTPAWVAWASAVGIVGLAIAPDATVAVLLVVGLVSVWRAVR